MMGRSLGRESQSDLFCTVAFGVLVAAVGIAAGGHSLPLAMIAAAMVGMHLWAERQGWLMRIGEAQWAREIAVTSVFSLLAVAFVAATGGAHSPLICALYLPILMATLCFGMGIGLLTGVGMAAVCVCFVLSLPTLSHAPGNAVAIGLSFPLVAIFGGVLRAQLEKRLRVLSTEKQDLSVQLDMSQMMESAFDLDMTLNLILLNVQQHTDCPVCAVYLKSLDGNALELRAASGPRDQIKLLPLLSLAEARTSDWSLEGAVRDALAVPAFYVLDTARLPGEAPSRLHEIDRSAASFACLPLASVEGLLGMLYVSFHQPRGLNPMGLQRLEQLAARAAFPLQRVLVQQDFRSLAYSDPMTGLDNFRQFEETFAEELARAARYDRPLSVILLDIDNFKSFNDTLGHQAGDALLGQLGVVLRNSLRNVDKPARYGGEEFVVVCPETGRDEARLIAERIRRNVADTAFALMEAGGEDGKRGLAHVTVSLGCATYPSDARSTRDLIKKADTAMYAAKESGRNAVCVYEGDGMRVKVA